MRGISTTAVQAFAMLNDAFLIRQCEHLAARIAARADTPEKQAQSAFQLIFLRPPAVAESAKFVTYITRHGLPNGCHLLLNSNEFLFVD